ncbi:reverse transcriptase domain-containing protein [Patescibacteria group bacterium]
MFDEIISLENLFAAWGEFRRGKRGKQDVQEFERDLEDNVFSLHDDLAFRQYKHDKYHRFHIHDPKHRIINKATVRDRLVHHAFYRVLYPIFDRSFIYDSYSCRIGKGTHAAVKRLEVFVRTVSRNYTGPCFALKCDIKKFFDSVDHEILLGILKNKIDCSKTNSLLFEIVNSYSAHQNVWGGGHYIEPKPVCRLVT